MLKKTAYRKTIEILESSKSEQSCILWTGGKNSHGYGMLTFRIRQGLEGRMAAHVFALEFKLGRPVKEGAIVCHICDTPACFNPNHLYEGTTQSNVQDSHNRNRRPSRKGEHHPLAKFKDKDIREIRNLYANGMSQNKLAKLYETSQQRVSKITSNKAWSHVI